MDELLNYTLFAEPSFIEGMSRVLDLGGTLNQYNTSVSGEIADIEAIRLDWEMVGNDIQAAIDVLASEQNENE